MSRLELESDGKSDKYKVEAIWDSAVYAKKSETGGYLPGFYYLVL